MKTLSALLIIATVTGSLASPKSTRLHAYYSKRLSSLLGFNFADCDYGAAVCCITVKGSYGHACVYTSKDSCDDTPEIPGWGKATESACCGACTRSFPAECRGCHKSQEQESL